MFLSFFVFIHFTNIPIPEARKQYLNPWLLLDQDTHPLDIYPLTLPCPVSSVATLERWRAAAARASRPSSRATPTPGRRRTGARPPTTNSPGRGIVSSRGVTEIRNIQRQEKPSSALSASRKHLIVHFPEIGTLL